METRSGTQLSIAWLVAETVVTSAAVVTTIAGVGVALHLTIGAVRLALTFIA
jgi:hypothetical protein